jgi:hypothetical protein
MEIYGDFDLRKITSALDKGKMKGKGENRPLTWVKTFLHNSFHRNGRA